jgi:hypothetical protein
VAWITPAILSADGPFRFTNVTASSRFISLRNYGGHGAQWAEATGDGKADLYVTNIFAPNEDRPDLFFASEGDGAFHESGAQRGVSDDGFFDRLSEESHAAVFADLDNDGDYDLFNAHTWSGNHKVYRNDGSGHFTDVSQGAGIEIDNREPRGVAAGDVNGDGYLDLVVSSWENIPMQVYHGRGDLTFERGSQVGRRATKLAQQGLTLVDYDGDWDLDLALTGHMAIHDPIGPIALYRNDGQGGFADLTESSGLLFGDVGINGWSFEDLDGDADLDAVIVSNGRTQVYMNVGGGRFQFRQEFPRGNYTVALGDFDNDGDVDMYIGGTEAILANDGRGNFETYRDVGLVGIGNDPRGTSLADFDGDGDLDIVVVSKRGPNALFRNDLDDSNWLRVRLVGPRGEAGAFGAKVFVYDSRHVDEPAHLRGFREARGATGYCSQNEPELHFGVPGGQSYEVKAVFPGGAYFIAKGVEAPALVVIDPRAPLSR